MFGKLFVQFLILLCGVIPHSPSYASDRPKVCVSILPQKYFVEKIAGDRASVSVMVLPGANPATYEPKANQMVQLARTDLFFSIGVPFETAWLPKIAAANPRMKIIRTDKGIAKKPMQPHPGHEKNDGHPHGIMDPHIWLSPLLVKIQAQHIRTGLAEADPAHASEYGVNAERFSTALDLLNARIRTLLSGEKGKAFMVFHPSWGYFADAYGLYQIPVEVEGKHPKPAQLIELIETARARSIRVIFVQPQFSARSAETIARAIGGTVVVADPLAGDWADNLIRQAQAFKAAVR